MSDEEFHEIELKGKQLVFLFMAATVVSVVIFLCGVMVGRGVRAPLMEATPELATDVSVDPTAAIQGARVAVPGGAPPSTQEVLTYAGRLEADTPVAETLRDRVAVASNVPDVPAEPMPAPVAEPAGRVSAVPEEPAGSGFVVQVMAARTRAEADRVAKGLGSKGYPAFVTVLGGAVPTPFRVRVGKYDSRREAESTAERLKNEEHFNTWITH